jgi:uncharacterized membrane protein
MSEMSRWLAAGLTIASLLWVVALVTAPFGVADGSVVSWLVYHAGGSVCHQRPERSFQIAGEQMPVCGRCFGLYLSGAMAAAAAWLTVPGRDVSVDTTRKMLALAALPTAVTLAAEWLALAAPSSAVRALAALPLGASAGWIFVRKLRADDPMSVPRPVDAL